MNADVGKKGFVTTVTLFKASCVLIQILHFNIPLRHINTAFLHQYMPFFFFFFFKSHSLNIPSSKTKHSTETIPEVDTDVWARPV